MRHLRPLCCLALAMLLPACDPGSARPSAADALSLSVADHSFDDGAAKRCRVTVRVDNRLKVRMLRMSASWESGWSRTGRFSLDGIPASGSLRYTLSVPMNRTGGPKDCAAIAGNLRLKTLSCDSIKGPCTRSDG